MIPQSTSKKDKERAARIRAEKERLQREQDRFNSSTARLPPSSSNTSASSAASIRTVSDNGSSSSSSHPYGAPSMYSYRSDHPNSSPNVNQQHPHPSQQQFHTLLPPPHRLKTPAPASTPSRPLPSSNGPGPPRPSFMQPPSNAAPPSPRARPQSVVYAHPANQQPSYPPPSSHHHSHSQSQAPRPVLPLNPAQPHNDAASYYRPSPFHGSNAPPPPPPSSSSLQNMAGAGAATRLDPSTGRLVDIRRQSVPVSSHTTSASTSSYPSQSQQQVGGGSSSRMSYDSRASMGGGGSGVAGQSRSNRHEEPTYATYADGGNGNAEVGLTRELTSTRSTMRSAEKLLAVSRGLRTFFQRTPQRNEFLIRVTTIFASNLEGHVSRLVAREMELMGQESRALASISRDFDKAASWLQENEQNLSHSWPTERTAKALKDLDERLTKSFTSKLAVALFEAVQDSRAMGQQISRQLEGLESDLPGMIKRIVAQANSQTIETTIRRLRIEETALKPRDGGTSADSYGGGEAEKTIQSLIDALESARLTQREKEERAEAAERLLGERAGRMSISQDGGSRPPRTAQPSMFPSGHQQLQAYDASVRSSKTTNSSTNSETSFSYQSTPMQSPGGLNVTAPPNGFLRPSSTHDPPAFPQSHHHLPYRDDKKPLDDADAESILFKPIDPISKTELLDPILASDGFIHDRFCFLSARPSYPFKPDTPLTILGDVTQLRLAIYARFPERKDECLARRSSYLLEAVRLADTGFFSSDSADALERLTGVLEWQGEDADTGVLVRRAILRWRVRHLAGALEDLEKALRLAPALPVRHWLAMVLVDLRRWSEAEEAISSALARDANAPLPLALRSIIHSQHGRTSEAYRDVELASSILASPPPNYTDEPQTSTDSKSTYSTLLNAAPSTPLPILLDLNHLATGHAWLALAEPVRASVPLARAIELGPAGEAWTRALWGYCLVQSTLDLGDGDEERETRKEGWRELEASYRLSADLGVSLARARGEGKEGLLAGGDGVGTGAVRTKPLRGAIGVLLAQAKAKTDPRSSRSILLESFSLSHPLLSSRRTTDELSFLGSLHAESGEYEDATRTFDEAVATASRDRRHEERAALMGERARLRV